MKQTKRFLRSKRYLLMWADRAGLIWLPRDWRRRPMDVRGLGQPGHGRKYYISVDYGFGRDKTVFLGQDGLAYEFDGDEVRLTSRVCEEVSPEEIRRLYSPGRPYWDTRSPYEVEYIGIARTAGPGVS